MPLAAKQKRKIERFLYKKGFTEAPLRAIILAQFGLLGALFLIGLGTLYFSAWGLWVFVGAALISFNFWSMSRFIVEQMPGGYSRSFLRGQLVRFLGRIALTGAVLAAALYFGASVVALGLGIFACLAVTSLVGIARHSGPKR